MTPRTLARRALLGAAALALALPAGAQIIKVPSPEEERRPITLSAGFGFLQSANRFDGQSGVMWYLGDALQYRASLDYGLRAGALGIVGSLASVPIQRAGGTAPLNSDGDIQLRSLLAQFRTAETQGPHQIIEVGLGLSQWANYSGTDVLTEDEQKARNALTLVVGYGFGFSLGERASLFLVQDLTTLWGSGEGLSGSQSRTVRQYTTRIGGRYRLVGKR